MGSEDKLGSPVFQYPVPASLDDPRFRWLFEYWLGRCHGSSLPSRRDVDPIDFPRLLGQLNLIDVVREAGRVRYRYRLWGTLVTEIIGQDYTGRYLDEIDAWFNDGETETVLREATRSKSPQFSQRVVPNGGPRFRGYRRLLLPLAEDGETVDMLLALMVADLIPGRDRGRLTG